MSQATVIFACVHNAGRSQMAAALFNLAADPERARAVSAGTAPGARVHPEVVVAMRELGVDLADITPQRLTDELAAGATMLVTMGCGDACPAVPGAARDDWPLEDPKGKPIERVREIRDDVSQRVAGLVSARGWARVGGPVAARDARAALLATLLDDTTKALPRAHAPIRLRDVGDAGWGVLREDLLLPVAVLKRSALDNNARWMQAFLAGTGALLAPHGKTTMCPQLFWQQLDAGAWAITVATVSQLQVCRHFGFNRLVLANQIVGRQAVETVVAELRKDSAFELVSLADSEAAVRALAVAARSAGLTRPVELMVEVGFAGGRTGCRTREAALALARIIAAEPALALRGIEGFEGLIHSDDHARDEAQVCALLDDLVAVARACADERLFAPGPVLLSAGGSAYYDLVIERLSNSGVPGARVVLRSGCYLTHDAGAYAGAYRSLRARSVAAARVPGELLPALEVWCVVQSRPEPTRAILSVGKRDLSSDMDLPVVLWRSRAGGAPTPLAQHPVVELNDQHAHVRVPPDSDLAVGDLVGLGISHPCTTFDKWRTLFVVDDSYGVTGAVRTFF